MTSFNGPKSARQRTVPVHINEIKPMYDARYQKERGPLYEYASGIRFDDYETLREFYAKNPGLKKFHVDHCSKQKVPKKDTDYVKSAYIDANTEWKCGKLNGVWDPTALSRSNFRSKGVCFIKKSDQQCAKLDCAGQIQFSRRGGTKPPDTVVSDCHGKCKRGGCSFQNTGECLSKQTVISHETAVRNSAIRKIQGQGKVMLMRGKVKGLADRKRRENAAVRLQKQTRVALRRKQLRVRIDERRQATMKNVSIQSRMAAKIQTVVRKHQRRADILPSNWPANLKQNGVGEYLVKYYSKTKNQWPVGTMRMSPGDGSKSRCGARDDAKRLFSVPQAMMHAIARGMVNGPNRGVLAWHSTGSGKTCTAASIMDAFWNTDMNIVFVTSIEAKSSNPPDNFRQCMEMYLKRKVDSRTFARRVKFFTFASLAHHLQLYRPSGPSSESKKRSLLLDNAVLIIDEVQNLLKPLPQQVEEHKRLFKFLKTDTSKNRNLKVFILTATPGDTGKEVVGLLNIVRDRRYTEIREPVLGDPQSIVEFKQKIQGIVQYYNTNNDISRFPRVMHTPVHKCVMSDEQSAEYVRAFTMDSGKSIKYPDSKYFATSRKYSGMMYNRDKNTDLGTFSAKLPKLLSIVKQYGNEKHWIYSAFYENRGFGQGVMGIKNVLENEPGLNYEMLTPSIARKMLKGTVKMTKQKRFCVLTTTQLSKPGDLKDLVAVFNSDNNIRGEVCQIMLASQKFNEGVDLKAVRHVHLFEPMMTEAMRSQAVGRARRNCSHSQYGDTRDWTVQVHEYDSIMRKPSDTGNITKINRNIQSFENTLLSVKKEQVSLTGVRGVKETRDGLKSTERDLKDKIKAAVKQKKTIEYNRTSENTDMIDTRIRALSGEYSGGVMDVMLKLMKNAAIDCKLMKKFHNDPDVNCK